MAALTPSHSPYVVFVSSPFAGHLHPALDLANRLREVSEVEIEFVSTPSARSAIEAYGFRWHTVLKEGEEVIRGIAQPDYRVGSRPWFLIRQLRDNLSLMGTLRRELTELWQDRRPDLVFVDFAVPVAGLLAASQGIPWWTMLASVCALERKTGVPTYLGGLRPRQGWIGKVRDTLGRCLIRNFKRCTHACFRNRMTKAGIEFVYRGDGTEAIYSPERILAFGIKELEFPTKWPSSLRFIGPLVNGPPLNKPSIPMIEGKQHVLVSLGTHLPWAKQHAANLIQEVAKRLPQLEFHFSFGGTLRAADGEKTGTENFHAFDYIPYDQNLSRYSASINHAGAGIMYACLTHAIPILAWPQDFDQFDHAARLEHFQLGLWCRPTVDSIATQIRRLLTDDVIQHKLLDFQRIIQSYDPTSLVIGELEQRFGPITRHSIHKSVLKL